MISIEESNQIISQLEPLKNTEQVLLAHCLGRMLAQPVIADIDQPPFNKSAMDGYACKRTNIASPLKVVGLIAAGTMVDSPLQTGECYRIFTGAPVPEGADCVIMQEDTSVDHSGMVHFTASQTKNNICYRGEDSKAGDLAIETGTIIRPQHLAIMAAYGVLEPLVYKKLQVNLFCSGSELVEPNVKPEGAMIRNSNAAQLLGQLAETGAIADYKGILPDNIDVVSQNLKSYIGKTDVIIITGGASVGDFDFVPEVLKNIGAEIKISALNIQPGKPVLYAHLNNTHILGLSGNPVSSFLQYKLLAEPLLLRLSGAETFLPKYIQMPVSADVVRKKGRRQLYTPVTITKEGIAEPMQFNGSAHIGALNMAQGFVIMEPEVNVIKANEKAVVVLI